MTPTRSPSQSQGSPHYMSPSQVIFFPPVIPPQFSWALVASPLYVPGKPCHLHHFYSISSLCAPSQAAQKGAT